MKVKRWWDKKARKAAVFITTDPPADPPAPDDPPADPPVDPSADPPVDDDPAKLFTPEEITAKKEAVAAAKAEEDRRAGLTEEQRAEEDRLKAEEEAKGQVPEKYEFVAPDGMTLNEPMVEKFTAIAKENGLSQDKAQALVDLGGDLVRDVYAGIQQAWEDKRAGWQDAAQSDKEIGADVKLGKDSIAARAFSTIATPEMKALMEELAIGDHPEVLRMFYRLGTRMKEDTFELAPSGSNLSTKDKAKTMYPSMD